MLTNLALPNGAILAGNFIAPAAGTVFFLDSGIGSDGNDGLSKDRPFATLDYAFSRCATNNGDYIIVAPGHARKNTHAGGGRGGGGAMGPGRSRPAFTGSGAIDVFNVSVANVTIYNLRIIGAAASVTALINTTTGGADFSAYDCVFEPGATPVNNITIHAP